MPIELGKAFNGGAEWVCGSSAVFGVMRNPVFTALLITVIALVIIYAIYRQELQRTGWRRGFRAGFWLFLGVSALVFVHYYALEHHLQKSHASEGVRNVVASIHHSATTGGGYAVNPGGEDDDPPPRPAVGPSTLRRRADNIDKADSNMPDDLKLEQVVLVSAVN